MGVVDDAAVLVVQDLFVREVTQYASFRGPSKPEGSIVNWLNGPIFRHGNSTVVF